MRRASAVFWLPCHHGYRSGRAGPGVSHLFLLSRDTLHASAVQVATHDKMKYSAFSMLSCGVWLYEFNESMSYVQNWNHADPIWHMAGPGGNVPSRQCVLKCGENISGTWKVDFFLCPLQLDVSQTNRSILPFQFHHTQLYMT